MQQYNIKKKGAKAEDDDDDDMATQLADAATANSSVKMEAAGRLQKGDKVKLTKGDLKGAHARIVEVIKADGGPSFPPNRVLVLTARTLNATGQSRVTLSPLKEHLRAACSPRQEENVSNSV